MSTGWCSTVFFCQWRVSYRVLLQAGLMVLLASVLPGCGEPKTPEQIVAERAQARWDALLAGNFETAYSFASPSYRDIVDAVGFQKRLGGHASWLGAKVREVTCREEACEAMVRLKYRSPLPPTMEFETDYTERWLSEGGEWWIFLKP
jgi:hypothetical protein